MRKILQKFLAMAFVLGTAIAWAQVTQAPPFGGPTAQYGPRFPSVTNPQQMVSEGERPATMPTLNANSVCSTVGRYAPTSVAQDGSSGGAQGAGHMVGP